MNTFNINDYVRVRLTPVGRRIHQEYWEKIYIRPYAPYEPPEEDEQGWSKWQLWELAHIFGASLYNGGKVPFETTIKLEDKNFYLDDAFLRQMWRNEGGSFHGPIVETATMPEKDLLGLMKRFISRFINLKYALWKVANPIAYLNSEAQKEGAKLEPVAAQLALDANWLISLAKQALEEDGEFPMKSCVVIPIQQWKDAYAAFSGAFDTAVMRRKIDNEYADDARKRLYELNKLIEENSPKTVN